MELSYGSHVALKQLAIRKDIKHYIVEDILNGEFYEMPEVCIFAIELPQLDTIISRILTYSQDFKSLERIVGDRLNEFEHYGYMKAYFNKGFTAKSNDFHIMYVFSTLPLEVFTPMSQRVKCPLIPSLHLSKW